MSTSSRIISGSAASWVRILITLATQLALVPIYLSFWSVKIYGIWIAIQTLTNLLTTFDKGFVEFLGYEFLKAGKSNKNKIRKYLWSGIFITIIIGLIELVLIFFLAFSSTLSFFFGTKDIIDNAILWQAGCALLLQWMGWTFLSNTTGLFFRALTVYGYFPRMGWWNVLIILTTSIIPVLSVVMGGDLLAAVIVTNFSLFLITAVQYIDIFKLLKKEGLTYKKWSFKEGLINYKTSLLLSANFFLDNFRQQGVRLILAPLVGITGLTTFSTIRTGANVAQQGLLTITQPLLPELMHFIKQKDQNKTEIAFDTVWLLLVTFLAPIVVILQTFSGTLFLIWTKGQIQFNPTLFATLSLGILVFALAQPAMAISVGNNLLKKQISISIITSIIISCGIILLIPRIGLSGAGISLLLAEIFAAWGYYRYAKEWLSLNFLKWPKKAFKIALQSIILTCLGMCAIILFPERRLIIAIITTTLLIFNSKLYWKNMSPIATDKIKSIIGKIPLFGNILILQN